jgi:hypothetical protein
VREPSGQAFCFSVEGLSPRWTKPVEEGFCPCERGHFCCHGDRDNYASSGGIAPMLGLKGLESYTQELSS